MNRLMIAIALCVAALTLQGCLLVSVQSGPEKPKKVDNSAAPIEGDATDPSGCFNNDLRREMRATQIEMLDSFGTFWTQDFSGTAPPARNKHCRPQQ